MSAPPLRSPRAATLGLCFSGALLLALPAAAEPSGPGSHHPDSLTRTDPGRGVTHPPPRDEPREPLSPGIYFQLGLGTCGEDRIVGTLDAAMATSAGDFIFRAAVSDELEIFGPSDWVGDLAFLYGRPFRIGGSGWASPCSRTSTASSPSAGWSSGSR